MINWNDVSKAQPKDKQLCYITLGVPEDSLGIAGLITGPILYDGRFQHFVDIFATPDGAMIYEANRLYSGKPLQWCASEEINMPGEK